MAGTAEVLRLIGNAKLASKGVGYVDAHLLASTMLCEGVLWTDDTTLRAVALSFSMAFPA